MLRHVKKPIIVLLASTALWPMSLLFMRPDADVPVGLVFHGEWALDVAIVMIVAALVGFVVSIVWLSVTFILILRSRSRKRRKVDLNPGNP